MSVSQLRILPSSTLQINIKKRQNDELSTVSDIRKTIFCKNIFYSFFFQFYNRWIILSK